MDRLKKIIKHTIINYQHQSILINIDILKHIIEIHIKTLGPRNQPGKQTDIHDEFLQKLMLLHKTIDEHIETYDKRHIHKL